MPFELQPRLISDLLEVRPIAIDDFDDLYSVASDPLLWEQHPDRERWRPEPFRSFFDESLGSGGALTAIDVRDRRIIGSSRYHGYDEERSEVEIGWTFLARSHWGGVYNGELKRLMLGHAFRFVRTVIFLVGSDNLRSQRAVEKIGGARSGLRRDGSGRQSLVYRIDGETWVPRSIPGP